MKQFIIDFAKDNMFFFTFFLFCFGACIGSFLNVCIFRMPEEDESVVKPASRCQSCKTPLKWYDNIPLFSFLSLRGKCRYCQTPISKQYIFIEIVTAYIFVEFFILFGFSPQYIAYLYLACSLLVATVVDIRHQIIPDEINFAGIIVGLVLSFIFPVLQGAQSYWMGLVWSIVGVLAGGGSILAIGIIGDFVFKKESMGGGDVKLMAMIGAFIGWKYAILTFFLAPFFGSVVGLYVKFIKKEDIIPYGPFLSIAAIATIFVGDRILAYLF